MNPLLRAGYILFICTLKVGVLVLIANEERKNMKTHKQAMKKAIRHAWKQALRRLVIQRPVESKRPKGEQPSP